MFHKMKLKPYLLSAFGVMILLAGIITALGIIGLVSVSKNTDALVNQVLSAEDAVKTCRIQANIAARDLREMLLTDDTAKIADLKEEINSSLDSITEQIAVFKKAHGTSDGLADQYESAFDDWFQVASKVMDEVDQGDTEAARQIILNECTPALKELVSVVRNIDSTIATQRQEAEAHTMTMLQFFFFATLAVFVVALAMALYIAFHTTKLLTKTVEKAKDAVSELSHGNLKAHMDYEGANEFGELAEKMNFSFQELSRYVDAIDYGMGEFSKGNFTCTCPFQFIGDFAHIQQSVEHFQEKIRNVLEELAVSSSQVSAGADQVADGAQALAQGATEQASSVEQLSASITDVSNRITDTADFSQKANKLGKEAGETVSRGKEEMSHLLASIQDIAEASNNIQSIIKVIDDIAFQTNILALNAAVEAARAGNAGKGFAVVADEVRSLAQKSAGAAKETTQLIKNSLEHVSRGEEIARRTDAAFNDVATAAQDILDMIEKIAQASNEQADSISQISVGIDQISSVVQTNSATSEESAAASEELSGQAGVMKNLLDQFQLKADKPASGSPAAADDQFSSVPSASVPTHYLSDKY